VIGVNGFTLNPTLGTFISHIPIMEFPEPVKNLLCKRVYVGISSSVQGSILNIARKRKGIGLTTSRYIGHVVDFTAFPGKNSQIGVCECER